MTDGEITLNIKQTLSEIEKYHDIGESDKLAELVLEFYKEGKYSYSKYKENNDPIPDNVRQQKGYIKRFMKSTEAKKYLPAMFSYLLEIDEVLPAKLRTEKMELKFQVNELQNKLNAFKQTDCDLKENAIQNEVDLRLEHCLDEKHERIQKQTVRIQDLISKNNKLEERITNLNETININRKKSNEQQLELQKELVITKKRLKKAGVPEKKNKKKKKKKKQDSDSDSDSDEEDWEYNNTSGGE